MVIDVSVVMMCDEQNESDDCLVVRMRKLVAGDAFSASVGFLDFRSPPPSLVVFLRVADDQVSKIIR